MGVAARAVGDEEREREVSRLDARVEVRDSDVASWLDDSGEAAPVTGEGDRTGDRLAARDGEAAVRGEVRGAAGERALIGSLAETAGEGAVDDGMGDRVGELARPLRRSRQRGADGCS